MFCGNCGKSVEEGNKFCTGCGQKITPIGYSPIVEVDNSSNNVDTNTNPINLGNDSQENNDYNKLNYQDDVVYQTQDKVNVWLVILGFLIPLVGLILFITLKKKTPKKAKAIGIAALISFILGVIASILVIIFVVYMFIGLSEVYNDDYNYNKNSYYDDYYYYEDYEFDYDKELDKLEQELEKYYNENRI